MPTDYVWHFQTKEGRDIQVLDQRATARLDWRPTQGRPGKGKCAYLSSIPQVKTAFGTVIVDPGMPKWMVEATNEYAPKLLDWFAKETEVKLGFQPLLLISGFGTRREGRSRKGGGLPGLTRPMTESPLR